MKKDKHKQKKNILFFLLFFLHFCPKIRYIRIFITNYTKWGISSHTIIAQRMFLDRNQSNISLKMTLNSVFIKKSSTKMSVSQLVRLMHLG